MNTSKVLLVCLLFTSLVLAFPSVHAQTTRIYEVVYPIRAVAGNLDPIPVTVIVFYNDTMPGYYLAISIIDADMTPSKITPGIVTSSPDACVNQPMLQALCIIKTTATSGAEHLEFKIGGILAKGQRGPGPWNFQMSTVLLDEKNNQVKGSSSSVPFQVLLTATPLLFLKVPRSVIVSLDGVNQPPGSIDGVSIAVGQHFMSVPQIADATNTTRLRFDHWSDGVTEATRTIIAKSDVWLEAVYAIQHRLTAISSLGTTSGEGWYDANSTATFSVTSSVPMGGVLGLIGAKWAFSGWYEEGQLVALSPEAKIPMNQAHTLIATWQADYTTPVLLIAGIIIVLSLAYLATHRVAPAGRRRRSRSRRR